MSLVIRVIVGFVIGAIGMSLAMTSRIASDGVPSISFSTTAAFAQEDSEPEAAPAEPAPAMPEAAPAMPAPEPVPYPQGAEQQAPENPYNSGNVGAQTQYQEDQARQAEQMQQQADQLRQQQEQMKQMINNMR